MGIKTDLKYLWRSKSLDFLKSKTTDTGIKAYIYNGKPIYYRSNSSDVALIYEILLRKGKKADYYISHNITPKVIFDIGGNIGATSIYFANLYPDAAIYTFEPVKENFELLSKNVEPYKNVRAFNTGLGNMDGKIKMFGSNCDKNFGGGSLYEKGIDENNFFEIDICKPSTFIKENIKDENFAIDLIKIDTEGAEYDILTSFDESVISKVKYIIGELHGINDFKLLDYLEKWFDIGLNKKAGKRLFKFEAINKINPLS